jgi:alkylhydroperoxidase family enzyme
MTEIPLPADEELSPEVRELLANLPPLNLFRTLGRLPESMRPFLRLGGSLLGYPRLDPRVREIAILRVAHATRAPYEWSQHVELGRAVGVTDADIAAVQSDEPAATLDDEAALACRVADEISRDVRLSDEALEVLLERYDTEQACALILCVSYYNMVSRFLESTRVEVESESPLAGKTPGEFSRGRRG